MAPRHRVLLLIAQPLLGEALEDILRRLDDMEVVGAWTLNSGVVKHITEAAPDVLLLAENEKQARQAAGLIADILNRYPDLPVFRVTLEDRVIRCYTSHTFPSQSADLVEAIRSLPFASHTD